MQRMRNVIIVAATLAMALTAIGAPVSAAGKGKVAIINGYPGRSIDICIGRKEIKSNVRYGQVVYRTLASGPKFLRIFSRDRRVCRGRLLARQRFGLPHGSDRTIVMTKFAPRILNFDNKAFPFIVPPGPANLRRGCAEPPRCGHRLGQGRPIREWDRFLDSPSSDRLLQGRRY